MAEATEGARGDTVAGAGKVVKVGNRAFRHGAALYQRRRYDCHDTETGQYLERA